MDATHDRCPQRTAAQRGPGRPPCGFDSSLDLGTWFTQQQAMERFGQPCTIAMRVKAMKAGPAGAMRHAQRVDETRPTRPYADARQSIYLAPKPCVQDRDSSTWSLPPETLRRVNGHRGHGGYQHQGRASPRPARSAPGEDFTYDDHDDGTSPVGAVKAGRSWAGSVDSWGLLRSAGPPPLGKLLPERRGSES